VGKKGQEKHGTKQVVGREAESCPWSKITGGANIIVMAESQGYTLLFQKSDDTLVWVL
jgi:hypothetical protein